MSLRWHDVEELNNRNDRMGSYINIALSFVLYIYRSLAHKENKETESQ